MDPTTPITNVIANGTPRARRADGKRRRNHDRTLVAPPLKAPQNVPPDPTQVELIKLSADEILSLEVRKAKPNEQGCHHDHRQYRQPQDLVCPPEQQDAFPLQHAAPPE